MHDYNGISTNNNTHNIDSLYYERNHSTQDSSYFKSHIPTNKGDYHFYSHNSNLIDNDYNSVAYRSSTSVIPSLSLLYSNAILQPNRVLVDVANNNEYTIIGNYIGQGRYSQIYTAYAKHSLTPLFNPNNALHQNMNSSWLQPAGKQLAIKVLKSNSFDSALVQEQEKACLLFEAEVLYNNQIINKHIPKLYSKPSFDPKGPLYIGMELLLTDCSSLRKFQVNGQFNNRAAAELALEMFLAVEAFHGGKNPTDCYLHRDLKPSNFGFSMDKNVATDKFELYLIDFGQSKHHIKNGEIINIPQSFKGTSLYASFNSHKKLPQGRIDDLFMLLFILIDLCTENGLPWKEMYKTELQQADDNSNKRDEILRMKEEYCGGNNTPDNIPLQFIQFLIELKSVQNVEIEPDYRRLKILLEQHIQLQDHNLPSLYTILDKFQRNYKARQLKSTTFTNVSANNNIINSGNLIAPIVPIQSSSFPVQPRWLNSDNSTPLNNVFPTLVYSSARVNPSPIPVAPISEYNSRIVPVQIIDNVPLPPAVSLIGSQFVQFLTVAFTEFSPNVRAAALELEKALQVARIDSLLNDPHYDINYFRNLFKPMLQKLRLWIDDSPLSVQLIKCIWHQLNIWAYEHEQFPQSKPRSIQDFERAIEKLCDQDNFRQFQSYTSKMKQKYEEYIVGNKPLQYKINQHIQPNTSRPMLPAKSNNPGQQQGNIPPKYTRKTIVYDAATNQVKTVIGQNISINTPLIIHNNTNNSPHHSTRIKTISVLEAQASMPKSHIQEKQLIKQQKQAENHRVIETEAQKQSLEEQNQEKQLEEVKLKERLLLKTVAKTHKLLQNEKSANSKRKISDIQQERNSNNRQTESDKIEQASVPRRQKLERKSKFEVEQKSLKQLKQLDQIMEIDEKTTNKEMGERNWINC